MSGLSLRTIQRVESGQSASLETLKSLAAVFEVNVDTLKGDITVIDKKSEELGLSAHMGEVWILGDSRQESRNAI